MYVYAQTHLCTDFLHFKTCMIIAVKIFFKLLLHTATCCGCSTHLDLALYLLWICPLHTYALLTQALVMGMHVLPGPAERTHHEEDLRESCMHSERPMHTGETSESSGIPISNMISTMYAPPKTPHVTCKYVKSN